MFSALLSKAPLIASRKMLGTHTAALGTTQLGSAAALVQTPLDLPCQQVRQRSNRSRRGLYDGKDVGFGNRVTFSKSTTRRKFKPNVIKKRVYSEILDAMIPFHMTTSALRSIDKAGGLDNYLMKNEFTEGEGYKIKKKIKKRLKNQAKIERKKAREAAVGGEAPPSTASTLE